MSTHDALPARWYSVNREGIATLCADEEDARWNAAHCDQSWPRGAPSRAVQLVDVAEVARAVEAERERCAELCDEEAEYREHRAKNLLPGDSGEAPQIHKAITARKLAAAIREGAR